MTATMTTVIMPQMGESITEATITGWRKKVGDAVEENEPLLDISTAKVEVEIPSPTSGVIAELKFEVGATVPIDTVIAIIAPKGAKIEVATASPAPAAAKPAPPAAVNGGSHAAPAAPPSVKIAAPAGSLKEQRAHLMQVRSTPLVRNMAREMGLDLSNVKGSGTHGRVTRRDLEAHLESGGGAAPAASPAPAPKSAPVAAPATVAVPTQGRLEPMTHMRKMIAEHMIRSRRTSAHAYTVHEVDFTRLMMQRDKNRKAFEAQYGVKLTPLAFILKALTEILPRFPILNAMIRDETSIFYNGTINMGVAVAVANGLVVPVLHGAENLSLAGICRALADKSTRARENKLLPTDMEGGTFTVTSPGQRGATMATPILNQPQTGILHVGAIQKIPCVIEDEFGHDVIAIRQRAHLTLGFDHRIVDGWEADGFMEALRTRLEDGDFHIA